MANTISNFLVGIGFDFDEDSSKKVDSAIDRTKSNALQLGAVLAGAFGVKALTADFAEAADRIGKFSEVFGVIPNDVAGLGRALTIEGGTMEGLIGQIETIEKLRAGFLKGDAAIFARAGISQIDANIIMNAENATEAYIALGDAFKNLSPKQRINAADAIGLDAASIRLLSKGSDEIRRIVGEQQKIRPLTGQMTQAAADFNRVTANFGNTVGGFADNISKTLLPAINDSVEGVTKFLNMNQDIINSEIDDVTQVVADNFNTIAIAGGLLASGGLVGFFASLARFVPIVGTALGVVLSGLAKLNVVAAAGFLAYEFWNPEDFEDAFGVELPDWLKQKWLTIDSDGVTLGDPDAPIGPTNTDPMIPDRVLGSYSARSNAGSGRYQALQAQRALDDFSPVVMPDEISKSSSAPKSRGAQRREKRNSVNSSGTTNNRVILENQIILDGTVIDRRIKDVTEDVFNQSVEDLQTSEGG